MMCKKRFLQLLLVAGVLTGTTVACKRDLGNYDYNPVNVISITTDTAGANRLMIVNNDSLSVKQNDTLKVNVLLSQTKESDDLSFSWMITQKTGNLLNPEQYVIGNEKQLQAKILVTPANYSLVLKVTDNKSGVSYYKTYSLNVGTSPWCNEGWLVLQNEAAASDLSVITTREGVNRGDVYHNVYSLANGHKLPPDAYKVNFINHATIGTQKVCFFYPGGGVQVRSYDLTDSLSGDRWIAGTATGLNFQVNTSIGGTYEHLISNNQYHFRTVSKNTITFQPVYFNPPVLGTWTLAPFIITNNNLSEYSVTLYDQANKCFLLYNASSGQLLPNNLPDIPNKHLAPYAGAASALDANTGSGFDLNWIGKTLIYAENAQPILGSGAPFYDCFFRNNGGDSTWLIQFATSATSYTNANTAGRFLLKAQNLPGINTASLFACPTFLPMPGKFYYAAGNEVYTTSVKALPAPPATPVYSDAALAYRFAPGTVIRVMKVFKSGYTTAPLTESKALVVATDETASGGGHKVYFFTIYDDGNVNGTPTQVYTGFNKIVDITFKKGLGL